jgi:hypothetical protein
MSEGKHLVSDTLEPLIESMQNFPTSLAQLQIQLATMETSLFDQQRTTDHLTNKL